MSESVGGQFDTSKVNPIVKYGIGLLLIIGLIDAILSGSYAFGIIATGIAWFYSAPQCVKWAQLRNGNQSWAFLIGGLFNLFGVLAYWLYIKRLHIPIIGGFLTLLIFVIFLIMITIIQLPLVYPAMDTYSKSTGAMGAFALFIVVFIVGCIIGSRYK